MSQFNRMRVTIGESGDFPLKWGDDGDHEDWAGPIRRALKAGHRWLVFLDDQSGVGSSFGMKTGIDLGDPEIDGLPHLRLQGMGRDMTLLTRRPGNTDPLFFSPTTTTWRIHVDGVTFDGEGKEQPDQHTGLPLCAFGSVEDSILKTCAFVWSGNQHNKNLPIKGDDGLHLGRDRDGTTGHARRLLLLHAQFANNADAALRILGADNIVMLGSAIEHNGHIDAPDNPDRRDGYGGMEWSNEAAHCGPAFSCHFEENGENGVRGLEITNGTWVRVANCYQWASRVIFDSTTRSSLYQNNLRVEESKYTGFDDLDSNLAEHNYPPEV